MRQSSMQSQISRRKVLGTAGKAAVLMPALQTAIFECAAAAGAEINGIAGIDRVVVLPGKTYLRGWAGYGAPPRPVPARGEAPAAAAPTGPAPVVTWSRDSGPGAVKFADPKALVTTATFSVPGSYVLRLTADNGAAKAYSTLNVLVETPPPARPLEAVPTKRYRIDSALWKTRAKSLMVNWIPHCIDQINRTDLTLGPGGIDNFVEAGKALRGEPHGAHKGFVFSNAWVYQTIESMSIALMIDTQGDPEIQQAHRKMRETLEDWIPKILAAQEPDGYLQTAFALPRVSGRGGSITPGPFSRWERRDDHEGYVAGYLLEAAINHYVMTDKKDARLFNAARKLADCWCDNLGPPPKKAWYEGHQEMEQALVWFGQFVNEVEGSGKGDKYIDLAKFLLDCRYTAARNDRERREYDQSHLPVIEQYEAVGHAVRAAYSYSAMADIALLRGDPDYRSAVKSLWDNIVNRKYYVTGGIGSGETSEGFGPNYSLRNEAYCESCSSCGLIFFQWKLNRISHDARYADCYEDTLYNALLGSADLDGRNFYYTNPLDETVPRNPWHNCPCCVGNIPRTLLMIPTWTYARSSDGIFVNLFIGSDITVENVGGVDVRMIQETDYPWSGKVAIKVEPKTPKRMSVHIRIPNRSVSSLYRSLPAEKPALTASVNGTAVRPRIENGYAVIDRTWRAGDRIDLVLPVKTQRVKASDIVTANLNRVALRRGPLVYCIEAADQDIAKALSPQSALTEEWRGNLLGGVTVVKSQFADGSPMLAIPYYARMNREPASPPQSAAPAGRGRGAPRPLRSIVWIKEG